MTNLEAKNLATSALKCNQAATAALNTIDQTLLPVGVDDVLYQHCEAIGQLCIAILELAE